MRPARGALLVGGEVGLQEVLIDVRPLLRDPAARGLGSLAGQVLPGGVAAREVESRVQDPAGLVVLDLVQPADPGRRLGGGLDLGEVLVQPASELPGAARAGEQERRRPLHVVGDDRRRDAARLVEQAHAAVVACDERALRGGERDMELPARVLAVDEQRARDPDRNLGGSDEVLDVATHGCGIERVRRDVLEARSGLIAHEARAPLRGLARRCAASRV
jgi:hypothetical protein